jgi:hypothetical protein
MSTKTQHEIHPDAEMLSAFAEQALGKHDRREVLAHLAACGRCRTVVELASEAAGAEAETPAGARHAVVRPRGWWRSWGLALAPVAALAATAVIVVYVHERDVERNAEVAKVGQQRSTEKAPMPPQPPAQAAGPVAATPAPKAAAPDRPHAARRMPVDEPYETASAPPPEAANGPLSARDESAPPSAEIHGAIGGPYAPSGIPAAGSTQTEVDLHDEEKQVRAEEKATEEHRFAAKAAAPASESRSESSSPGSGDKAAVADEQFETQAAPPASSGSLMGFRGSVSSAARNANRLHLPSELPAISIAHKGPRMLAIDNAGALFFSQDSGANWEPVAIQWTGLAVLVRKRAVPDSAAAAPPADKSNVAGDTTGSEAASEADTVFELLNDQGQLWWSTDGRIWTAK